MQPSVQTEGAYSPPILSLGEIMDRAVTLCVRHASPLFLIIAVPAVFEVLVKVFLLGSGAFADDGWLAKYFPAATWIPHAPSGPKSHGGAASIVAFIDVIDGPLMIGAIVSALAGIELGVPIGVGAAYASTVRHWRGIFHLALRVLGPFIVVFVVIVIVLVFVLVGLGRSVKGPMAGVGALVIIAPLVIAVSSLLSLSSVAVFEGETSREAFRRGWQLTFSRRTALKTWWFFIVWFAISTIGSSVFEVLGAALYSATKVAPLFKLVSLLGAIVIETYVTVVLVLFYHDMRVRLGWKPA